MAPNDTAPPRLAEGVVKAAVRPSSYRDSILGDLREGFAERAVLSQRSARSWYRRQAFSIAARFIPVLIHDAIQRSSVSRNNGTHKSSISSTIGGDLRDALLALRRRPALPSLLVATLALGIGANGAIFGVVRSVLLQPLAFPDPDGVVTLWSTNTARGTTRDGVSRQDAADWAEASRTLIGIGTYTTVEANVVTTNGGVSERARISLASPELFRVLGVAPFSGRTLISTDDTDNPDVAVVSHAFWQRALGADRAALGHPITVDGKPVTVVGVMPPSFDFPDAGTVLWKPFGAPPNATGPRQARWVSAVGRLRPGLPLDAAGTELASVAARLARQYPASNRDVSVRVEPRLRAETEDVRLPLLFAWAMAGLVLIIVAANSANLLLARAAEREGEMAVRAALGAGRTRLVRQSLAECALLAVGAGALGGAFAVLVLPLLRRLEAVDVPRLGRLTLDPWMLVYSMAISLTIGLAFGVAPALRAARTLPAGALRRARRGSTGGRSTRMRASLVVSQVALAAVVLVATGLLSRSFARLSHVEPGIALNDRASFRVAPDWGTYPARANAQSFYDQLLARLAATPGTISVAAVNRLPLTGSWWTTDYEIEGRPATPGTAPTASYRVITPGYFSTTEISVLKGRAIEQRDRDNAELVVVVSRAFADRAFIGERAIDRRITFDPQAPIPRWYRIVGIVGDVHTRGLADAPEPLAYVSLGQARFGHFGDWGMDVVMHTRNGAGVAIAGARRELREVAPSIPMFEERPLGDLVVRDLGRRRVLLRLLAAFAATAYLIGALGIYGIVAYDVTRRRAELGLRMALGAGRGRVWGSVVLQSVSLAAAGTVIGLAVAAAGSRALAALLFGVRPLDPVTFTMVGAALVLVAAATAWVPAFRASRVSPLEALRAD